VVSAVEFGVPAIPPLRHPGSGHVERCAAGSFFERPALAVRVREHPSVDGDEGVLDRSLGLLLGLLGGLGDQAPYLGVQQRGRLPGERADGGEAGGEVRLPAGEVGSVERGGSPGQLRVGRRGGGEPGGLRGHRRTEQVEPFGGGLGQHPLQRGQPGGGQPVGVAVPAGGLRLPRGHRMHLDRRAERLADGGRGEVGDRGQLVGFEQVDLAQQNQGADREVAHVVQERSLACGHRRDGGGDEDGEVHVLDCAACFIGVVLVHASGPRRVNQLQAGGQQRVPEPDHFPRHLARVLGVARLGDQLVQDAQICMGFDVSVEERRLDLVVFAGGDRRGHGGQRKHAGGQHMPAEQGVEQGGLAALGLAGDQHAQPALPLPLPQRGELLAVRCRQQQREPVQGSVEGRFPADAGGGHR
jgi:hypothetical protein